MGELNQHNLKTYIDNYELQAFVETGTGIGTGLCYALSFLFDKLFSIEINDQLYQKNIQRIKDPRCCLIHDNSLAGLKRILEQIKSQATLFWLDAHFPGADFKYADYDDEHPKEIKYPLENELRFIFSVRDCQKDVFIIDDLQLYEEGNFQLKIDPDFIKKHKQDSGFIYELFSSTHNILKDYRHQGFWIIIPKRENV